MPAEVISTEEAFVDNSILRHYVTSGVAFEEPEIGSSYLNCHGTERYEGTCSLSNRSKLPVWFRLRVGPGTGPLQRVSTQNPLLKSQHFLLQLSVGVLIVSRHNAYVKYPV